MGNTLSYRSRSALVDLGVMLPAYVMLGLIVLPSELIYLFTAAVVVAVFAGMLLQSALYRMLFLANLVGIFLVMGFFGYIVTLPGYPSGMLFFFRAIAASLLLYYAYTRGVRLVGMMWYEVTSSPQVIALLILYPLAFFVALGMNAFTGYQSFLGALVGLSAVVGLILMNRFGLMTQVDRNTKKRARARAGLLGDLEAMEKNKVSQTVVTVTPTIKRQNNIWIALALLLSLILLPVVALGVNSAGSAMRNYLNKGPEATVEQRPQTTKPEEPPPPEREEKETEADNSLDVFNIIFEVIGLGASGLMLVFAVLGFSKKIREWFKRIAAALYRTLTKKKAKDIKTEDREMYTETVEELELSPFNGRSVGDALRELLGFRAMKNEEERIRFLYRLMVKKAAARGYRQAKYKTATETMNDLARAEKEPSRSEAYRAFAEVYGATRYGGKEQPDGEAARVKGILHI